MENLDVPFFEMAINGTDLTVMDGSVVNNFVTTTGYDNARRKIEGLDHQAVDFQVQLIRGASAAKSHRAGRRRRSGDHEGVGVPGNADALGEAELIGDHLLKASFNYGADAVEWLGIHVLEDLENFRFGPLGIPSTGGGSVWCCSWLLLRASSCRVLGLQTACGLCPLRRAGEAVADRSRRTTTMVARSATRGGWGRRYRLGLLHLTDLLPELDLGEGLSSLLLSCDEDFLRADERLDVVFGVSGLIGPLLKLGSERALHLAETAGAVLLDRQDASGGWMTSGFGATPLTGFSHGASGMAAAAAALHRVLGGREYGEAARRAVLFERSTFDPVQRNWPDFRSPRGREPTFMLSWCHGAPGIALSRLCMGSATFPDEATSQELKVALASTSDLSATAFVDSLCCGRFGRAAILRLAASQCGDSRWLAAARALEERALDGKQRHGQYASIDSPGLFSGLSGVGLALLEGVDDRLKMLRTCSRPVCAPSDSSTGPARPPFNRRVARNRVVARDRFHLSGLLTGQSLSRSAPSASFPLAASGSTATRHPPRRRSRS